MPETPLMSPRSAAIEQYRSGAYGQVPDAPEDTLSPEEAKLFLESIKPERYAALASVIDVVLSTAFDQRAARLSKGKGGLLKAPPSEWGEPDDPWIALSADFSATLRAGQKSIPHDALKTADEYVQLVSDIDPERHIKISTQLTAGINTASTTMTNLLRNMPHIITRYHETAAAEDFPDIARNSLSLVGRLALGCVNRLMAAREGLTENQARGWFGESTLLDPNHFTFRCSPGGFISIHYTDLESVHVPHRQHDGLRGIPDTEKVVTIGDIACSQNEVIGCPITLLHGRMRELWNWQIDEVMARSLWEQPA